MDEIIDDNTYLDRCEVNFHNAMELNEKLRYGQDKEPQSDQSEEETEKSTSHD